MDTLLEQVLHSPILNKYSQIIQEKLEKETQKRKLFYKKMSEQEKTEFIEGEIIVHSPVKRCHALASNNLFRIISAYVMLKELGEVHHEKALIQLTRNDYEPDICFFMKEKVAKFDEKQMFFPTPDFIVEVISKSTEKRDRGIKFEDYALHGVGEYWLVDTENKLIEQYKLYNNCFEIVQKISSGILRSLVIDGFSLPVNAVFDEQANLNYILSLGSYRT